MVQAMAGDLDPAKVAEVAATAERPVAEVTALLAPLSRDESVLERMAKPWEKKPWHQYKGLFLTRERIEKGRAFAEQHTHTLARAEAAYGVPRTVILAIIGVETMYGERMGDDPIATALFTLGFHHARRGKFFRAELGHYVKLSSRENWSFAERKGSYAGAMGMGQFMPSSYLEYAVDFDGDGSVDLFGSPADAIGSVANYLSRHGWQAGDPILLEPNVKPGTTPKVSRGLALDTTIGDLAGQGVTVDATIPADTQAKVFRFETTQGRELRVGLANFYVITRYNRSSLYARAVTELAAALEG